MHCNMEYIIWGGTGQAKVLHDIIVSHGDTIALFVDNARIESPVPEIALVVGEEGLCQWLSSQHKKFYGAVAIGGHRGKDRLALLHLLETHGLTCPSVIHPSAFIATTAKIHRGSQVLPKACVGAYAKINVGCIVNTGSIVEHDCFLEEGVHIAPGVTLCGCVHIKRHTFIGAGSTILPRVTIGENSVIGAGAIVTKDVPDNVVAMGAPIHTIIPNVKYL